MFPAEGTLRSRMGSLGNDVNQMIEYEILVHKKDYEKGFNTEYSAVRRNETSPLTYHKTLNYRDCVMEKRSFRKRGIQEPIFLNTKGELQKGLPPIYFL